MLLGGVSVHCEGPLHTFVSSIVAAICSNYDGVDIKGGESSIDRDQGKSIKDSSIATKSIEFCDYASN